MTPAGFLNYIIFNSLLVFVFASAVIMWLRPRWWLLLFTLFLGFVVGWLDLRITEVSASVLMLLTFGFFSGFAQPKRWWLWTLALGLWVPAFAFIASNVGATHPTPTELITSSLALVFPLVGSLAGALVRRLALRPDLKLLE